VTVAAIQRRLLLEQLLRKRRASDYERYVECFRRAAVDANPHQLEAVAFALGRIPEGGAMLCDEVGLGKTIEAGLILTQLRAEGKDNILIIVPLSLSRQWQAELMDLFGLRSTTLGKQNLDEVGSGIYIAGREFAARWADKLKGPWDLVVFDEAHEGLSSIYHRYQRVGGYLFNTSKGKARQAAVYKQLIADSPVLLLTATPLQNNLLELWGLVHFVDPRFTLLGTIDEYVRRFVSGNGRTLRDEEAQEELRQRLKLVMCRTLRSQAQPFLKTPFTRRSCETINFHMEAAERELYQGVSDWLAGLVAIYRNTQRKLVATQLRRRMGSSVVALAHSLTRLRERLEEGNVPELADHDLLENDFQEILRLEKLSRLALQQPSQKIDKLVEFIQRVEHGQVQGVASDKVVIFTESTKTLSSIVEELTARGLTVTAFSGSNDSDSAKRALEVWKQEVGQFLEGQKFDPSSAVRAALVHEFRHRSRILVATEAGAKGLNLQFCNCLVNYDLPWNPQRIEQRIGRVHRYGQAHDVVIVNFINLDNEGEERAYEILREKLRLFEGVLGASDPILGSVTHVLNFEARIVTLLDECRTPEQRKLEFDRLEAELDEQARSERERGWQRARSVLSELDPEVQARLTGAAEEIPLALSRRDQALMQLVELEAPVTDLVETAERRIFTWKGQRFHLGRPQPGAECGQPLTLDHPLLQANRRDDLEGFRIAGTPSAVWEVYRLDVQGIENEELLVVAGPPGLQEALNSATSLYPAQYSLSLAKELDQMRRLAQEEAEARQKPQLERLLRQLAARKEDVRKGLDEEEKSLRQALARTEKARLAARTPEQSRSAVAQHRAADFKLKKFLETRAARQQESLEKIEEREQEIHRQRYVTVEALPLLCIHREEDHP